MLYIINEEFFFKSKFLNWNIKKFFYKISDYFDDVFFNYFFMISVYMMLN